MTSPQETGHEEPRVDLELEEASREVDLTLIREFLRLSPMERLRAATQHARTLDRFRHGRT